MEVLFVGKMGEPSVEDDDDDGKTGGTVTVDVKVTREPDVLSVTPEP